MNVFALLSASPAEKPNGDLHGAFRSRDERARDLLLNRRAQALGFSLKETRELLALSSRRSVATIKRAAQQKLADVEMRLADLQRIRQGLDELVRSCPGHGRAEECPILRALGGTEDEQ